MVWSVDSWLFTVATGANQRVLQARLLQAHLTLRFGFDSTASDEHKR